MCLSIFFLSLVLCTLLILSFQSKGSFMDFPHPPSFVAEIIIWIQSKIEGNSDFEFSCLVNMEFNFFLKLRFLYNMKYGLFDGMFTSKVNFLLKFTLLLDLDLKPACLQKRQSRQEDASVSTIFGLCNIRWSDILLQNHRCPVYVDLASIAGPLTGFTFCMINHMLYCPCLLHK